jgi:hypothetical protein
MEVVLKKIKITKAIIKQMYELPFSMFNDNLDVFGYVNNINKYQTKTAIIYNCDTKDCYTLNMHWQKRGKTNPYLGYNGAFRGEMVKRMDNIEEWYEAYYKIVNRAEMAGHLYI